MKGNVQSAVYLMITTILNYLNMKRFLTIFLSTTLAVTGLQAQGLRSGAKALGKIPNTVSKSGKVVQGSWRAGQSVGNAGVTGRLNIKPKGFPIVIPNLDTDDRQRNKSIKAGNIGSTNSTDPSRNNHHSIKRFPKLQPLPKLKSMEEYRDERIAAKYDSLKAVVTCGFRLRYPYDLFELADYALRHDDEQFAILCLERVQTDEVSPERLYYVNRLYKSLDPYMPEISKAVAVTAYCKMIDAKLKGTDCDTARMQHGDTLLMITDKFDPSLRPLVTLSCFYNPNEEVKRYKEAADSVIVTYDKWDPAFKNIFARHFFDTLFDHEEFLSALEYFGREPLKEFPEHNADFALKMADCALVTQNDSLFTEHFEHALSLDSIAAEDYWSQLYMHHWDQYLSDPTQHELADWLILNSPEPANNALLLALDVLGREIDSWDIIWGWEEGMADISQHAADYEAVIHILDKGLSADDGRSRDDVISWCQALRADILIFNPETFDEGNSLYGILSKSDNADIRCNAIIGQAIVAAHGLDNPKEGLKILKKNIKQLDNPEVSSALRHQWYDYMAHLSTRLGKTKDAGKYTKLKEKAKAQ